MRAHSRSANGHLDTVNLEEMRLETRLFGLHLWSARLSVFFEVLISAMDCNDVFIGGIKAMIC